MANYECKKGWLLAPDENGENVPFFIYVRSKDIMWGSASYPDEIIELARHGYNATTTAPQARLRFNYSDWAISIDEDLSFEATLRLSIGNSSFVMDAGVDATLYQSVKLPIKAVYNENFSIQSTIQGNNDETRTAYSGVDIIQDENKFVAGIKVELNNQILKFHKNFSNISSYLNSYVYITVKGVLGMTAVETPEEVPTEE